MNLKKVATIAATVGALTALAVPAMAETSIYGSARLTTFWNTVDTQAEVKTINEGVTSDFQENLHANSRLGVNFTNGTQGAKVELGVGTAGVTTRHIYGTQKFDFGTVLVGQTENPYYLFSASVAKEDGVNNNYGALWDTRQAQLKLTLNSGIYVAAIIPSTSTVAVATTESYMPKLNVGYEGKAGNFAYGAGVVGQTYKQTIAAAAAKTATTTAFAVAAVDAQSNTVTSVMGYVHGKMTAGAAAVQFNLGVGQNMGDMGFTNANAVATNKYVTNTATLAGEDTTTIEGYVQGSYTLSPMFNLNAGVGYVQDDNSLYAKADNRMMMFVNTNITLAKGFVVTPEFAYFDQLDNIKMAAATATAPAVKYSSSTGDKEYLVGARWMMNF